MRIDVASKRSSKPQHICKPTAANAKQPTTTSKDLFCLRTSSVARTLILECRCRTGTPYFILVRSISTNRNMPWSCSNHTDPDCDQSSPKTVEMIVSGPASGRHPRYRMFHVNNTTSIRLCQFNSPRLDQKPVAGVPWNIRQVEFWGTSLDVRPEFIGRD